MSEKSSMERYVRSSFEALEAVKVSIDDMCVDDIDVKFGIELSSGSGIRVYVHGKDAIKYAAAFGAVHGPWYDTFDGGEQTGCQRNYAWAFRGIEFVSYETSGGLGMYGVTAAEINGANRGLSWLPKNIEESSVEHIFGSIDTEDDLDVARDGV